MRRYFFDVKDGAYVRDDQGCPFPDDDHALRHARTVANELCRNRDGAEELQLIVRDEYQNTIFYVPGGRLKRARLALGKWQPRPRSRLLR